jgi:hypothetical protein
LINFVIRVIAHYNPKGLWAFIEGKEKRPMGDIASINFKPVKANSARHNERLGELDYVYSDLTPNNDSWSIDNIEKRFDAISTLYKEKVGQKIQAKATPIREAVVNLRQDHTIESVRKLTDSLKKEYGLDAFQIHIHRDEGKTPEELNYHAHILFDWQNKETGKSFKLNRQDMSRVQDITAESLGMSRGELKENSNTVRLEAVEYKRQEEEKRVDKLQEQVALLEQKKNEAESRFERDSRKASELESKIRELELQSEVRISSIKASEGARERRGRESREREESTYKKLMANPEGVDDFSEEEIERTIVLAQREIDREDQNIKQLKVKYSSSRGN